VSIIRHPFAEEDTKLLCVYKDLTEMEFAMNSR
jgi:hypothetical protein